jgi:hypothetical protein
MSVSQAAAAFSHAWCPGMTEGCETLDLTAILLTANRPERALEQIGRTSGLFRRFIVADGGSSQGRLHTKLVTDASRAMETLYVAEVSWTDRLATASSMASSDLVLLMPDDDVLNGIHLAQYVAEMNNCPRATVAGGPWLTPARSMSLSAHATLVDVAEVSPQSPWEYLPWLFYGVFRSTLLRTIGKEVIPLTVRLAERLAFKTYLSQARLIELAIVLSCQYAGTSICGSKGFWQRETGRTWKERMTRWEGYRELESAILLEANMPAIRQWSSEVTAALPPPPVRSSAFVPSTMLTEWATSASKAKTRYPRAAVPLLRRTGRAYFSLGDFRRRS